MQRNTVQSCTVLYCKVLYVASLSRKTNPPPPATCGGAAKTSAVVLLPPRHTSARREEKHLATPESYSRVGGRAGTNLEAPSLAMSSNQAFIRLRSETTFVGHTTCSIIGPTSLEYEKVYSTAYPSRMCKPEMVHQPCLNRVSRVCDSALLCRL